MKKEVFKKLDQLIKSKDYSALPEGERNWVDEILGKSSYEELHALISGLSHEQRREPSRTVRADLVQQMRSKHISPLLQLFNYRVPSYMSALAVLVFTVMLWLFIPAREVIVEKPVTINVPVVDTLRIQLPADTVYVERMVRVEVPIFLTRTEVPKEEKKAIAKSFGEKRELQEFLVSGD